MTETQQTVTDRTHQLTLAGVPLTVIEQGEGHPVLILHGGGGPQSLGSFPALLAARHPAQVFTPIHPGFGGTPRPDSLAAIGGLAILYRDLLDELDLQEVTVIGNSIGGWIAAEMAQLRSDRIGRLVLVDAVGIAVDGHPVADIFPLTLDELMQLSYHDPVAFRIDPAAMTEAQRSAMAANRAALRVYAGDSSDPGLLGRLSDITSPTLVVWGASDQIVDPEYGEAYAGAIAGAQFVVLPETGHLPQLESPEQLLRVVWDFVGDQPASLGRPAPHVISLPGPGGQPFQADPAVFRVFHCVRQPVRFCLELLGVLTTLPRRHPRHRLGGECPIPVGKRSGVAGDELGIAVCVATGEIRQAGGNRHCGNEMLAAAVVGDRASLHPVIGRGICRVQRLLALGLGALLGQAAIDQVPGAVVQLYAEPAVQVPAASLLRDYRGSQVAPAVEAVLSGDDQLGFAERDLGRGLRADLLDPGRGRRVPARVRTPEFLGLCPQLAEIGVVGQVHVFHVLSIATRVRCGRVRQEIRAWLRITKGDPGALGTCRGREAPWCALARV